MAITHTCDRCGKDFSKLENPKIHHINYRLSVSPKIEEVNDICKDNFNDLEFCEKCATLIIKELHKPLDESQKTLGI